MPHVVCTPAAGDGGAFRRQLGKIHLARVDAHDVHAAIWGWAHCGKLAFGAAVSSLHSHTMTLVRLAQPQLLQLSPLPGSSQRIQ